jgi:hypothetical protein
MPRGPNNVNFPNGLFVEETNVWDQMGDVDLKDPEDLRLLFTRLYQNVNLISVALNLKHSGIYDNLQEFVTGMNYFPDPNVTTPAPPDMRAVYRTTLVGGPLTNGGNTVIPHHIDPNADFKLVRAYGAATDPVGKNYTPIPNTNLNVLIDATNVT